MDQKTGNVKIPKKVAMDDVELVSQIAQDLLTQVGYGGVEMSVQYDSTNNLYHISLSAKDPALLIGYHGDMLSALQLILGLHLHTKTDKWLNLSLNVNDYRERRETTLHSLADSVVDQVVSTGRPHMLPPLPANERRIIHLHLAEHPQVTTSSQGVGRSRSVVISPKA